MRLTTIALQNLKRRRIRSLLLVFSITIGIASTLFLFSASQAMNQDVQNKLDEYGSNILIVPDNSEALTFGGITVQAPMQTKELNMSIIPLMKTIKNKETLAHIAPKLLVSTKIDNRDVLVVGVQFANELKVKKWWKINGLPQNSIPAANDILVGSDIARLFDLKLNQTLSIKGQNFRVAGIIQPTGSVEDDQAIFTDLSALQKLSNQRDAVSLIEVAAFCYTCPIDQVTDQLRTKLPGTQVTALRSSIYSRDDTVKSFQHFALILGIILLLACGLAVGMTIKSSVEERTKEIGILRTIGFKRYHILEIILLEAAILSITGGIMGYFLGMGLSVNFGPRLMKIQAAISWHPLWALYASGAALVMGILACTYPIWKIVRLNPVESLRYL